MKWIKVVICLFLLTTVNCNRKVIDPEKYLHKLLNRTVELTFETSKNYPSFSEFKEDFTGNNSRSLMNKNVVGTVNFHSGFITTIRKVEMNPQNIKEAFTDKEVIQKYIKTM